MAVDFLQLSSGATVEDGPHRLLLMDGNPSDPNLKFVAVYPFGDHNQAVTAQVLDNAVRVMGPGGICLEIPIQKPA